MEERAAASRVSRRAASAMRRSERPRAGYPAARATLRRCEVPELETLVEGLDFGEGPRWHDGRLWYSDFYQHRVSAVTRRRRPRDHARARRPPERSRLAARRSDARGVDAERRRCCGSSTTGRWSSTATSSAIATGRCNDMVVSSDGNAYVGNFGFEIGHGAERAERRRSRSSGPTARPRSPPTTWSSRTAA